MVRSERVQQPAGCTHTIAPEHQASGPNQGGGPSEYLPVKHVETVSDARDAGVCSRAREAWRSLYTRLQRTDEFIKSLSP